MQRRQFMKTAAATGAGVIILPSGVLSGKDAPSNKLNIALVGAYGRATAHYGSISSENVVAICDIREDNLAKAAAKFPNAKKYSDWRKAIDQKDVDAVVCCTADHVHAHVANWSMNRGLHVYCEKPLANCVNEARTVRATYLKNKGKLATQVGTQRHSNDNFARVRELVLDGAIGELKNAYAWGNRKLGKPGYLPAKGSPPATLDYDLWIGPSPYHPYNPGYFSGRPGANCLNWNMYWDFGSGQVGDMGSHTMDLAWCALDADVPTSAKATGDKYNPDVSPVKLEMHFKIPANDWRDEIGVSWYQGGAMPRSPKNFVDLNKIGHGAMFKGSEGFIVADFTSRLVLPYGKNADMSYYNRRPKEKMIPPLGHFQKEWIDAAKGDLKTTCNFDYAGKMIEMMMLGLVAYRVGKELKYDGAAGKTDDAKANELLTRKYREGWPLNG